VWRIDGPEGNESEKIHNRVAPFVSGHGIDIGCGIWKLKVTKSREHSCLGVDGGFSPLAVAEADVIADVTNLSMFRDESFDYAYSSHTLEDMHYTEAVLREWWRLVKVGGNFILYLPLTRRVAKEMGLANWEGFYPNIGEPGANFCHQRDFHPQEIRDLVAKIGDAEILADEIRGDNDEYSFLLVFRKLASQSMKEGKIVPDTTRRALVVRYG
jgi:SAM-dependent methyltransferase